MYKTDILCITIEKEQVMGGKGSGRFKKGEGSFTSENNPMKKLYSPENVDTEANSKVIQFGMELMSWDEVDFSDTGAIRQRFLDYLEICDKYAIKPMLNGMVQAFKMNRNTFYSIISLAPAYSRYRNISAEGIKELKNCYNFLQTSWEIYITEEKGNPVKWFFLGKNYFGYEDQTVRINRTEPEKQLESPDEIAAKYANMLGQGQEGLMLEPIEQPAEDVEIEIEEDD